MKVKNNRVRCTLRSFILAVSPGSDHEDMMARKDLRTVWGKAFLDQSGSTTFSFEGLYRYQFQHSQPGRHKYNIAYLTFNNSDLFLRFSQIEDEYQTYFFEDFFHFMENHEDCEIVDIKVHWSTDKKRYIRIERKVIYPEECPAPVELIFSLL